MAVEIENNKSDVYQESRKKTLSEMLAKPLAEIKDVALEHMRALTVHSIVQIDVLDSSDDDKKNIRHNFTATLHKHMLELDAKITTFLGELIRECENESSPFGPFAASREMFLQFLLETFSAILAAVKSDRSTFLR